MSSLQQKQLLTNLIDELSTTSDENKNTQPIDNHNHNNSKFRSSNGFGLKVGDQVKISNRAKTGHYGDLARVIKFNKKFVALELEKNQSYTQRASKNLELLQE